jgi:YidC/Oxa1 family membrane protein insertase
MGKLRLLAPKMKEIREKYKGDKPQIQKEMIQLYKKEKANPVSGCLPMLLQIPVFIALYWVLMESVELRQAPFIFWIHDLSAADPYYVLPVLMGLSMFLQQRLNPAPPDPTQAKIMMAMPIIFTVMFLSFPSGLVLYWLVNNCISILQQWYVTRKFSANKK